MFVHPDVRGARAITSKAGRKWPPRSNKRAFHSASADNFEAIKNETPPGGQTRLFLVMKIRRTGDWISVFETCCHTFYKSPVPRRFHRASERDKHFLFVETANCQSVINGTRDTWSLPRAKKARQGQTESKAVISRPGCAMAKEASPSILSRIVNVRYFYRFSFTFLYEASCSWLCQEGSDTGIGFHVSCCPSLTSRLDLHFHRLGLDGN